MNKSPKKDNVLQAFSYSKRAGLRQYYEDGASFTVRFHRGSRLSYADIKALAKWWREGAALSGRDLIVFPKRSITKKMMN